LAWLVSKISFPFLAISWGYSWAKIRSALADGKLGEFMIVHKLAHLLAPNPVNQEFHDRLPAGLGESAEGTTRVCWNDERA
jgi:hypothetical protein